MTRVRIIKVHCDICTTEILDTKKQPEEFPVIFTTEQTEGRPVKPYLTSMGLDVCHQCTEVVLSGKIIFAHGAQGHNTYYFKKDEK